MGAQSINAGAEQVEKLRLFGEKVGIAFQIKDDLFDYGKADVGKPTGNDIKEKKLTLPLIYTLNTIDKSTRRELVYIIKNQNKDAKKVGYVLEKVIDCGGISYANEKMIAYRDDALSILHEFPESEIRNGIEELVRYTTDRKY